MNRTPTSQVSIESIQHSRANSNPAAWAHVSGWSQLSGTPRTLSCIVHCRNESRVLASLVPHLSDTLTEAGYPWQITFIDNASDDATRQVLEPWSQLPGFKWIHLANHCAAAAAMWTGLCDARGDAAIFIDASMHGSVEHLPELIARWELGNEVVFVQRSGAGSDHAVVRCGTAAPSTPFDRDATALTDRIAMQATLIDRRVIDALVAQAASAQTGATAPAQRDIDWPRIRARAA